jgi:hypothetical protein
MRYFIRVWLLANLIVSITSAAFAIDEVLPPRVRVQQNLIDELDQVERKCGYRASDIVGNRLKRTPPKMGEELWIDLPEARASEPIITCMLANRRRESALAYAEYLQRKKRYEEAAIWHEKIIPKDFFSYETDPKSVFCKNSKYYYDYVNHSIHHMYYMSLEREIILSAGNYKKWEIRYAVSNYSSKASKKIADKYRIKINATCLSLDDKCKPCIEHVKGQK